MWWATWKDVSTCPSSSCVALLERTLAQICGYFLAGHSARILRPRQQRACRRPELRARARNRDDGQKMAAGMGVLNSMDQNTEAESSSPGSLLVALATKLLIKLLQHLETGAVSDGRINGSCAFVSFLVDLLAKLGAPETG